MIILKKPVTRLAYFGLAALIVNLKMKLGLFERWLTHACLSPYGFVVPDYLGLALRPGRPRLLVHPYTTPCLCRR